MDKNIEHFINSFKRISQKGWIKSYCKSFISVGVTFEKELGKNSDSMFFPDYDGIEIKCCQRFSMYPLNLFSKSLDGPFLFSTNEFLQRYGSLNSLYDKNELIIELNTNNYTFKNGYGFKINVNEKNKRIYIETIDSNNKIEKIYYVDFSSIENVLKVKFNTLAFIRASMRMFNNDKYFRYYSLQLFKLKSFETFIKLLKENIIKCTFIGRVSKTDYCSGKNKNKGLHFSINKEDIRFLFEEFYSYSSDKKTNRND